MYEKNKKKKQDDQVFHKLFLSNLIYTKIKSTYKPIPSPFSVSSLVSSITPYRFLGFQLQGVWTPLQGVWTPPLYDYQRVKINFKINYI